MNEVQTYDLRELMLSLGAVVLPNGVMSIVTPNGRKIEATEVSIYHAKNGHKYLRLNNGKDYAQFRLAL